MLIVAVGSVLVGGMRRRIVSGDHDFLGKNPLRKTSNLVLRTIQLGPFHFAMVLAIFSRSTVRASAFSCML